MGIFTKKRKLIQLLLLISAIVTTSCSAGVYVCMGSLSRRYHKTESCKGLRRCGGRIEKVSKERADSMFRTPCHICYSVKERNDEKRN